MRAYAAELTFFSIDSEKGAQLIKIDPAGHYAGYKAVSCGCKEQELSSHLEKNYKSLNGFQNLDKDQLIRLAIKNL